MTDTPDVRRRNPPGRPPLERGDPSVRVTLALPGRAFDQLAKRATLERLTIPEMIRRALANSANKGIQTTR